MQTSGNSLIRSERALVALAATIGCGLFTWFAGKEVGFDTLNYHYYAGFAALHDRLGQDFMPASVQSYFNPYTYVPFYLLAGSGLPAIAVGLILAAIHGINIVLCWWIAHALFPAADRRARALRLAAAGLAALTPAFLLEVGAPWADVLLSVPLLVGVGLIVRRTGSGTMALAGFLLGAAIGLKPTQVFLAAGCLAALLAVPGGDNRWRTMSACAIGLAAGVALTAGFWAWQLWTVFGNPVFPLFNGFFHSPDFVADNLAAQRFRPPTALDWLLLPLHIAAPSLESYAEVLLPDLKPLLVSVLGVLFAFRYRNATESQKAHRVPATRLLVIVVVGFVAWAITTTNARYGLTLFMLAGVAGVFLLHRVSQRMYWQALGIGLALALQGFLVVTATELRFNAQRWSGPWFDVTIDDELRARSHLLVTIYMQPGAFVMPFLAPGSAMMNIYGQNLLRSDGPGGSRAEALLTRYTGRTLLVMHAHIYNPDGSPRLPPAEEINWRAANLGLALADDRPCWRIRLADDAEGLVALPDGHTLVRPAPHTLFIACPAVRRPLSEARRAQRDAHESVFMALEAACRKMLRPAPTLTAFDGKRYHRWYANSEITVEINREQIFLRGRRGLPWPWMMVSEVQSGAFIACPLWQQLRYESLVSAPTIAE